LCVQEKRFLEETKNDADRKHMDFDILNDKHEKMQSKFKELEMEIKPIEDRLEAIMTIERDFGKLQAKENSLKTT
jgi:hypothetical protein